MLIPYARVQEVFKDQFDLKISQGSLSNFNKEAFEKLEVFELNMIGSLSKEEVINADETGAKVDNELAWIHVLATNKLTWAKSMKRFLEKLSIEVDEGGGVLSEEVQIKKIRRYREIIKKAKFECPKQMPTVGSGKRKVKQTKERNLLDRLCDFEDQVLLFMTDKRVPFTNNQAERDIRMVKVQQKVSGQFKSMNGAKYFCRIRSYLMTSKKRGHSPFDKLGPIFDSED